MAGGLYLASLAGAAALVLLMPRRRSATQKIGLLVGSAALGGAWLFVSQYLPDPAELERRTGMAGYLPSTAMVYYYLLSAIAIVAAVRVITHRKPVYAALWFVLVVLSSAGLFLVLSATFMAFALIIIYAGAILVTYVFVIMLATEPGDEGYPGDEERLPLYDSEAREPIAASVAGFLLLAVLLTVAFKPIDRNASVALPPDEQVLATTLTDRPINKTTEAIGDPRVDPLASADRLTNPEWIGLDLFESHPLGLELAGVILLVSLIGAVLIARQRLDTPAAEIPE